MGWRFQLQLGVTILSIKKMCTYIQKDAVKNHFQPKHITKKMFVLNYICGKNFSL